MHVGAFLRTFGELIWYNGYAKFYERNGEYVFMKKRGLILLIAGLLTVSLCACGKSKEVVVYTAIDEVFADEVIKGFEEETGIKVKVVYDSEANKTTGLVNRIKSEEAHPLCDVFWNNEFMQTIDLSKQGLLESYVSPSADTIPDYYKASDNTWTAMGGRARVLLVNNGLLSKDEFPVSVRDFANGKYPGDSLAIAYPMFGTTKTMAAALYAQWGEAEGRRYFEEIKNSGVNVVDGNSVTKDMAATGQVAIGFTDSDDAKEAIEEGADVTMVYPDQGEGDMGTLMTPSTLALIKGGPNPDNARIFIDYVLSEKVERQLVDMGFYDISIRDAADNGSIKGMSVPLEDIYSYMDISAKDMEEIFATAK